MSKEERGPIIFQKVSDEGYVRINQPDSETWWLRDIALRGNYTVERVFALLKARDRVQEDVLKVMSPLRTGVSKGDLELLLLCSSDPSSPIHEIRFITIDNDSSVAAVENFRRAFQIQWQVSAPASLLDKPPKFVTKTHYYDIGMFLPSAIWNPGGIMVPSEGELVTMNPKIPAVGMFDTALDEMNSRFNFYWKEAKDIGSNPI